MTYLCRHVIYDMSTEVCINTQRLLVAGVRPITAATRAALQVKDQLVNGFAANK